MFLGNTLDTSDPMTSMFMAGSNQAVLYDWPEAPQPQSTRIGKQQSYPTTQGLHSTLGEDQFSHGRRCHDDNEPPSASQTFLDQAIKQENNEHSAQTTPGLSGDFWNSWIHESYTDDVGDEAPEYGHT